jgi:hypothetical protein
MVRIMIFMLCYLIWSEVCSTDDDRGDDDGDVLIYHPPLLFYLYFHCLFIMTKLDSTVVACTL